VWANGRVMVGLRLKILREGHKERRKDERLSYRIAIIGDVINGCHRNIKKGLG